MKDRQSIFVAFLKVGIFTFFSTFLFMCLLYFGLAIWGYYNFGKWHLGYSDFEKSLKVAALGACVMLVVGLITKIMELREEDDRKKMVSKDSGYE